MEKIRSRIIALAGAYDRKSSQPYLAMRPLFSLADTEKKRKLAQIALCPLGILQFTIPTTTLNQQMEPTKQTLIPICDKRKLVHLPQLGSA